MVSVCGFTFSIDMICPSIYSSFALKIYIYLHLRIYILSCRDHIITFALSSSCVVSTDTCLLSSFKKCLVSNARGEVELKGMTLSVFSAVMDCCCFLVASTKRSRYF